MRNTLQLAVLVFVSLTFLTQTICADLVYDNGAGGAGGFDSTSLSDDDNSFRVADDVSFATTQAIGQIDWTGVYFFGNNTPQTGDNFTVAIIAEANGEPAAGTPLATFNVGDDVNRVDSGFDFSDLDVYEYSATIDFTMQGGTTYWISIYNDTAGETDNFGWGMLSSEGNAFATTDSNASWQDLGDRMDFRLSSVPEPNSLTVAFAFGLLALRRTKKRNQ